MAQGRNKTCFKQPRDFDDLTVEFPMEIPIDRGGELQQLWRFLRLTDMRTLFTQPSRIRMLPNIVDHQKCIQSWRLL